MGGSGANQGPNLQEEGFRGSKKTLRNCMAGQMAQGERCGPLEVSDAQVLVKYILSEARSPSSGLGYWVERLKLKQGSGRDLRPE